MESDQPLELNCVKRDPQEEVWYDAVSIFRGVDEQLVPQKHHPGAESEGLTIDTKAERCALRGVSGINMQPEPSLSEADIHLNLRTHGRDAFTTFEKPTTLAVVKKPMQFTVVEKSQLVHTRCSVTVDDKSPVQVQDLRYAEERVAVGRETDVRNNNGSIVEESTVKAGASLSGCGEESPDTQPSGTVQLYIETAEDLQEFLTDILKDFVTSVSAKDLADHMIAAHCLTMSDIISLNGNHMHTCPEQARKLWDILTSMSVEDFKTVVFPHLLEHYSHIIPESYCRPPVEGNRRARGRIISHCLRHNLMLRARLTTVADNLCQCRSMKLDKWKEIYRNQTRQSDSELWSSLFGAISGQDDEATQQSAKEIGEVLQHYRLEVPMDLAEQIRTGVQCTCSLQVHELPPGAPPLQAEDEEEGEDICSLPSSFGRSSRLGFGRFQVPGSQYLGSDDPDFHLPELDPEFRSWAKGRGLSEATLRVLAREDFTSREDLKLLDKDSMENYLPQLQTLPGKQRQLLKKLIEELVPEEDLPSTSSVEVETEALPSVPGLSQLLPEVEDKVRLLLVGKTGAGKSASGNTALGEEKFNIGLSLGSTTRRYQFACSADRKVEVMDCPGLFDTSLTQEELCTIIVQALLAMYPRPTAVLYTIRIGDHYTDEEFETYRRLKILFGEKVCRSMIVLFTRGDELKKAGMTIEEYVRNAPERFKKVLRECGSRYVVFDNTKEGRNEQQLVHLKEKVCELMARDQETPTEFPLFSVPKEKLQAEIRRLIKKFGSFKAKEGILSEEEMKAKKESLFWEIWHAIKRFLAKFVSAV